MARDRPGGEPTEKATPKRLREARRKGQVARSRDLSGLAVFAAVAAAALATGPLWVRALAAFVRDSLGGASAWPRTAIAASLGHAVDLLLLATAPALGAGVAAAVLVGLFQVRPLWTWKPLKPELSRLNALKGLKQLVSLRRLTDLLKSIVALTALVVVLGVTLWEAIPELIRLEGASPAPLGVVILRWAKFLALRGGLVLLVVAAVDYGLQRYRHERDLRMTKEEVKREHKESEGDPQHKSARKRLHQELTEHDMVQQVSQADLVVVNPTHLAVALRYDDRRDPAPRVVAKGQRLVAARIKEVARQARVPIFHDVGLARALHELEPGDEIPEALYDAVADLLRVLAEEGHHADPA
jgi:flagellar biosynthesis protein FlhB